MSACSSDANVLGRQGDHRPLPAAEVGADPAPPPRPGAGRVRHQRGDGAHRRAARHHPGRGVRHGDVLRDVQVRAGRARTASTSARTSPASCSGRGSCSSTPRSTLGVKAGGTTDDGMFTLEDVECIAACTEAPALQVNYRYRYQVTHAEFDRLVDDLARRPARRRDPAARHAGPRPPDARPPTAGPTPAPSAAEPKVDAR